MKKSVMRNGFMVVLLLSNTLFIYKWWMAPEHRHPGPRNQIIEKLHFDEQQVAAYDELIHEHRRTIEHTEHLLQDQKQHLYSNLEAPFSDSILEEILKVEAEIEHIHFNHFKDIEKLCKPNQKKYFQELNQEIAHLFTPLKGPKR
jgi:periplasmic protein CpxP/Spy